MKNRDPNFQASVRIISHADPYEISPDEPVVKAIERALIYLGQRPELKGKDATTDGHIFVNKAHIPAAIFGPGDESLAHTNYEYVEINKVLIAAKAYALIALDLLG
ncbi:MAG: M20/M25/M40 family metallo-hydrolase [Nitrososphaerales archaeon]|nr:M20/M25/M40 family metallo-hydrolase [Nitrososphaerales archaeon]